MWLRRRVTRLALALLTPVLAVACSDSNFEPEGAQAFAPPAVYRDWWADVQRCTGVRADFDRVRWYRVVRLTNVETGRSHAGAWQPPHRIYLERHRIFNRFLVKHEMVHDLLQRLDHDTPLFERCAGV